ncbi:hypothetical protein A2U01_0002401 [Trifolium medium]|uniref:Uncharacterized protein n=1 Tax=Trifolium medium TaxID=97028 RepID=A0A392M2T5_9FABA|nr:hypothetical protein [Trifolium medium]
MVVSLFLSTKGVKEEREGDEGGVRAWVTEVENNNLGFEGGILDGSREKTKI